MSRIVWDLSCPVYVCMLVAQSCPTLCNPTDYNLPGSSVHGDSPGKNTGVGIHALLQGIFLTQGSNPCLPYCRRILYCLSYQGSPWLSLLYHKNLSSQPHYSHQHINIYFTCEKNKIFDYTYPSTNPPSPTIFWFLFPQSSYQYLSKLTTSTSSSLIISLTHS